LKRYSFDIAWNIHSSTVETGFKCAELKLSVIKQIFNSKMTTLLHNNNKYYFAGVNLTGQIDVSFLCVCLVIDHKFRHNIVKVAVDLQTTLTICYDEIHCQ